MDSEAPATKRTARERALDGLFTAYKTVVSPALHAISPSRCAYLPTCSEYAYAAVSRFGLMRGSWLALRRLARCHPWAEGGADPLPLRTGENFVSTTRVDSKSGPRTP